MTVPVRCYLLFAVLVPFLYWSVCGCSLHQQVIAIMIRQEDVSCFLLESSRECEATQAFMSQFYEVKPLVSVLTLDRGGPL